MKSWMLRLAMAFIAGLSALPVAAVPERATTQVTCRGTHGIVTLGPSATDPLPSCSDSAIDGNGSVFAQADLATLSALAQGIGASEPGGFSRAEIRYFFEITVPEGFDQNLLVPVVTDVHLRTSITGGGHNNHDIAQADVVIDQSQSFAAGAGACIFSGFDTCHGMDAFDGSFVASLPPLIPHSVLVEAAITLNSDPGDQQNIASAYADPIIRIDPDFLAAHLGYGLVFSPNLSAVSAVPEPATSSIFGAGLAALLWVLRRRRTL